MKIFEIVSNQPVVTTECLLIPEFSELYKRDKTKDKSKAFKEMCYIYFSTDYKSMYLAYDEDVRQEMIIKDYIGDKKWKPDDAVLKAIEKYKDFQRTPSIGFLEDCMKAVEATRKYFREVDYSERDHKGNPVYKIKEVTSSLGDCEKILNTLEKLKKKIQIEQQMNDSKARGGGNGGLMEFD
jgi:hypothetical protein